MRILYCASEANPFCGSGGLADVAGSLPHTLCRKGQDARIVVPLSGISYPAFATPYLMSSFMMHLTRLAKSSMVSCSKSHTTSFVSCIPDKIQS